MELHPIKTLKGHIHTTILLHLIDLQGRYSRKRCIRFLRQLCQFWAGFIWHRRRRKKSKHQNLDGLNQHSIAWQFWRLNVPNTEHQLRGSSSEESRNSPCFTLPSYNYWSSLEFLGLCVTLICLHPHMTTFPVSVSSPFMMMPVI